MRLLDDRLAAAATGFTKGVSADFGSVNSGISEDILPGIQSSRLDHRREYFLDCGVQTLIPGFT